MPEMGFVQSQAMKQQMRLSPQMLMAASLMSLPSEALCDRIYEEIEKNPALEVTKHATVEPSSVRMSQHYGNATQSDEYQSFLESVPMPQETLQEHLQAQLDLLSIDKDEYRVGYKIIHNLDGHGYNVEDPETLLNSDDDFILMKKMLSIVQRLDPPGTACKDLQQTLLVQSKIKNGVPPLVFLILKDYFSILSKRPSTIYKILTKDGHDCTLSDVENVIAFIRTLQPYPAGAYSSAAAIANQYIEPEAIVSRQTIENGEDSEFSLVIDFLNGNLPKIEVSSIYEDLQKVSCTKTESEKQSKKFASEFVSKANVFIEALEQRRQSLHKIITALVYYQSEYFEKGSGHLKPLRMIDIAEKCKVDESTVSRIVNDKYIQCEWGLIEIKSLFTGGVNTVSILSDSAKSNYLENSDLLEGLVSRDFVLHEINLIIENNSKTGNTKSLSDQKISNILASKGIKVARRTVSKYRRKLHISSSYDR